MSKNLDNATCLQSEKRQEWIQQVREGRLQVTAEGRDSAPHLANSSTAPFPFRNKCPGTHCGLIVMEESKDSSCQMCQNCLCQKEKEQSHQFRSPDREVEESQDEQELHLFKEEGRNGNLQRKGWTSQRRKVGFKEGREGKHREPHKWGSGCKSSP